MFSAGAGLASSAFSAVGGGIADGLASQTGYRAGNLVGRMGAEISDLAQGVSNTAGQIAPAALGFFMDSIFPFNLYAQSESRGKLQLPGGLARISEYLLCARRLLLSISPGAGLI